MKKIIDVLIATIALIVLLPVVVVVALLVRIKLGSPVLYRQIRPGYKGRPFTLIKFRSMANTVDIDGKPLGDEKRLSRFGQLLRASSLDELPELWNVIKGEMSLVGPRPLLMEYLPLYSMEQMRRHDVLPGITGWAQVNGRNTLSWDEKFVLDLWYVDNHCFSLDMKIIYLTLRKVISREGVTAEGLATTEKFKGNDDE